MTTRYDWLVFVAVTLAVPTLWLSRLAPLVAVPRLLLDGRASKVLYRSEGPTQA